MGVDSYLFGFGLLNRPRSIMPPRRARDEKSLDKSANTGDGDLDVDH